MQEQENTRVIVIMAGGSGTRLWPLSRKDQPKQFHAFLSDKTLLEETYDRAKLVVPKNAIFISTNKAYFGKIQEILPEFPEKQLILEPCPKGTAPAIGLISAIVEKNIPGAIIATIASDHAIENEDAFVDAIKAAFSATEKSKDKLVVIGINPTSPDTGLGYIRMGERFSGSDPTDIFFVDEFKEKPDQATAESYLSDWRYLWNAGYFIFSAKTMLGWIDTYAPDLGKITKVISTLVQTDELSSETLSGIYKDAPSDAIEPLIVEKLPIASRLVVPAPMRWSDIGSWGSLYEFFKARQGKDSVLSGNCIEYDGRGNLIYGTKKRTITTFGVKDLVIVDTDDAILIADRHRSNDIKKLIENLKQNERHDLL
jgi:mannose-1-phosphate guanylyltransferase